MSTHANTVPDERLLSIPEACERLGVCRSTLYRAITEGDLVTVEIFGRRLIHPADLATMVEARRRRKGRAP